MLHGRVQTTEFLHSINLAPSSNCVLCGLNLEDLDHLFLNCPKSRIVWIALERILNTKLVFGDGICSGYWLLQGKSSFITSMISIGFWLIWKARCGMVFKKLSPNFISIPNHALDHVCEYHDGTSNKMGKFFANLKHLSSLCNLLFTDASWISPELPGGIGFVKISTNNKILLVGSSQVWIDSSFHAEALALDLDPKITAD